MFHFTPEAGRVSFVTPDKMPLASLHLTSIEGAIAATNLETYVLRNHQNAKFWLKRGESFCKTALCFVFFWWNFCSCDFWWQKKGTSMMCLKILLHHNNPSNPTSPPPPPQLTICPGGRSSPLLLQFTTNSLGAAKRYGLAEGSMRLRPGPCAMVRSWMRMAYQASNQNPLLKRLAVASG